MSYLRSQNDYEPVLNWEQSQLSLTSDTRDTRDAVSQYRSQAQERLPRFTSMIENFAQVAGVPVIIVPPCVKEQASAERKVWDRTTRSASYGHPEKITDYLRATLIVPQNRDYRIPLNNLRRVMDALIEHPDVTGRKDQFHTPEKETGYRSFKTLMNVDGHRAELLVTHGGLVVPHNVTAALRNLERQLRSAEATAPHRCLNRAEGPASARSLNKFMTSAESMIGMIREMRSKVHNHFSHEYGLDELLGPEARETNKVCSLSELRKTFEAAASISIFGKAIAPIISKHGSPLIELRAA